MHKGKLLAGLILLVITALFVYGVTELLIFRFQKGDVYPAYSSYRSDPKGTKAFYEGLGLLPGVETVRNVEPLQNISGLSEATLFLFGLQGTHFFTLPIASVKAMEDAALGGGRIVLSFVPTDAKPAPPSSKQRESKAVPQESEKEEKIEEEELYDKEYEDLSKRWSVKGEFSASEEKEASLSAPEKDLPAKLAWYSTLAFDLGDDAWRTLYTRAGKPVLIERSFGKGSIVLSSDSFFLSNEAMKSKRSPQLLSWLCGGHRRIIFDETHLGVSMSPGVVTLLRKYGLAPFFISLIVLALLALWKQSARFVPGYEDDAEPAVDAGKDASTGYTNLLRRNIPPEELLPACLEEWKRSFTHGRQNLSGLLPSFQKIIAQDRAQPKKNRNPVEAYRQISALGTRREHDDLDPLFPLPEAGEGRQG
jgi:hypothetical protein